MVDTPAPQQRFSVLHVDDFDEFLEEFRALFGPDFDITSAQSGAEGLALLEGRDFDAVILDYEMPARPLLSGLFERLHPPDVAAELHVSADAAPIPGDPLTLEQVFANLISNSFQYRNAEQDRLRVDVEARLEGGETEVVYRDNGMGIAPEDLDRIFDMSFTTDRTGHFGLGLSFAKKIVEAHGGTIRAASAGRGHGATFIMRLPLPLAKRKALAGAATR